MCFDHFFWAAAILVLARILRTGDGRWWLLFGVVCGLGLLNKISVLFLGFGLVVGLLLTPHRRHFLDWRLYAGGAIALLIFLPHIVWEQLHGWPMIEFTSNAAKYKNAPIGALGFLLSQLLLMHPLGAPIWMAGLAAGFFAKPLKPYRLFSWLFLAVFLLLSFSYGKDYYLAPAFFAIVPLAGLFLEQLAEKRARFLVYAVPAVQIIGFLPLAPLALPILPVETFLKPTRPRSGSARLRPSVA
jgi:4-amino-4-deoxy-L-arabinose transferase-like glycosyltransferase